MEWLPFLFFSNEGFEPHWPMLDEDISVSGLLHGQAVREHAPHKTTIHNPS
jgi:hypothetical protein